MEKEITEKQSGVNPTKVVYLFGAGATQAEISLRDDTIRLLMKDIRDGMLSKIDKEKIKELQYVKNELADENSDVEHLLTLYESTGISEHDTIAKKLKELFMREIQERVGKLGKEYTPRLLSALIDMHNVPALNEELKGIITLNYEELLERAFQDVKGGINYSISMNCLHDHLTFGKDVEPILKLYGSFNWKNEFPISLTDEDKIKRPEEVLWIPPGVEKRRERYPFSILWGRAREILDCDILRVIGCSLNRNDWQLIALLYTTQKLTAHKKVYLIELIDYHDKGVEVRDSYTYLSFRLISDIKEIRDSLKKSYFKEIKEEGKLSKAIESLLSNPKINIFDTWLRAKGEYLKDNNIAISTKGRFFENYINEVSL